MLCRALMRVGVVAALTGLLWAVPYAAGAARIAMFFNSNFVDTSTAVHPIYGGKGEAVNLKEDLEALGHTVMTFTGYSWTDFVNNLRVNDVFVVPEQEGGALNSVLSSGARGIIYDWVCKGGGCIIMGSPYSQSLLNGLFSYELGGAVYPSIMAYNDSDPDVAVDFPSVGATLWGPPNTWGFLEPHLHTTTLHVYRDGTSCTVFANTFGYGHIAYLGYDWFGVRPADWGTLLDQAMEYAYRDEGFEESCDAPWLSRVLTMHSMDIDSDFQVDLSELLRVVQFFNSDGFHVEEGTEDGYAPGLGEKTDAYHAADTDQDWHISLSELLRAIQFFNMGEFHQCPNNNTEDRYCPGAMLDFNPLPILDIDSIEEPAQNWK